MNMREPVIPDPPAPRGTLRIRYAIHMFRFRLARWIAPND